MLALIVVVVGLASMQPKSRPESVNRPPVADFSFDANNLKVVFDASASNDPDGSITNYSWSFGDGAETVTIGPIVMHAYPQEGTYETKLTVTDNGNIKNTTKKDVAVKVNVPPVTSKPLAVIKVVSIDGLTVKLTGADSKVRSGGSIVSYAWTFEGEGSATGVSVQHTFAANGTYNVTLTVADDLGETNTTTVKITVNSLIPPPPENRGPPGLLHAIEIHTEKADRNGGLQNSLNHLKANLDRWLYNHPEDMM